MAHLAVGGHHHPDGRVHGRLFRRGGSYRFVGASTLVFIALTSLLMRLVSTRYTEIAEILQRHNIIGGGVCSFSYYVLGPTVSFIAAASILVGYIITACISRWAPSATPSPSRPTPSPPGPSQAAPGPGDHLAYRRLEYCRH